MLRTIRYADIFALPLTATQLWRYLLVDPTTSSVRWAGHHAYSLRQVQQALVASVWLQQKLDHQWGYYCLKNRAEIVPARLRRHRLAQAKWKILQRVVRLMVYVPFVRMIAGSGSLALYNTTATSDLDVFVVARRGRIWTTRLLLLMLTQLTGRRRKHWDRQAPDKICLNHYVTDDALLIAPQIRTVYTAMVYTHLVPLYGHRTWQAFTAANAVWLKRFIMYSLPLPLPFVQRVPVASSFMRLRRQLEALLLEPGGKLLERGAEYIQRRVITRHTLPGQVGRVFVSAHELAFHPHSKAEGVLHQFAQEEGQQLLL